MKILKTDVMIMTPTPAKNETPMKLNSKYIAIPDHILT